VWSVRTGMELRRPDGSCLTSGRELFNIRTRAASIGRMVKINRSDARDLSAYFQGSARLDGITIPSGRRTHRGYIYTPDCRSLHPTPQNPSFWPFVSKVSFWIFFFLLLFVLLQLSHIPGILLEISC
jgi:hypothetical protein